MKEAAPVLCPSSPLESGAILVGVVLKSGRIAYAADQLEMSEDFVASAKQSGAAEKMFRFASPCSRAGCRQWTGTRCSIVDEALEFNQQLSESGEMPECSIRAQCRWFAQTGPKACAVCPYIITDARPQLTISAEGQV